MATRADRTCVHCGLDDSRFNPRGTEWILLHPYTRTGVCSHCAIESFNQLANAINHSDFPHVIAAIPLH